MNPGCVPKYHVQSHQTLRLIQGLKKERDCLFLQCYLLGSGTSDLTWALIGVLFPMSALSVDTVREEFVVSNLCQLRGYASGWFEAGT